MGGGRGGGSVVVLVAGWSDADGQGRHSGQVLVAALQSPPASAMFEVQAGRPGGTLVEVLAVGASAAASAEKVPAQLAHRAVGIARCLGRSSSRENGLALLRTQVFVGFEQGRKGWPAMWE